MHQGARAVPSGRSSRPKELLLGCAVLLPLLLTGCLGGVIGGECSDEEAAAFNAIPHYGGEDLVREDHPYGACADVLVTSDDPEAVVEHYQTELMRAGYDVGPIESGPMTTETGEAIGSHVFFQATKSVMTANVSAEIITGQETQFVILVGDAQ